MAKTTYWFIQNNSHPIQKSPGHIIRMLIASCKTIEGKFRIVDLLFALHLIVGLSDSFA